MLKKTIKKSQQKKSDKKKRPERKPKVIKTSVTSSVKKAKPKESIKVKKDYLFAVGRRKSSTARVRFYKKGDGEIIINTKDIKEYFPYFEFENLILEPLTLTNKLKTGKYTIKVNGGGKRGQAESIRLGISRILFQIDNKLKPTLKSRKLLARDPRVKERKKYGLRKARRAPQWQKR